MAKTRTSASASAIVGDEIRRTRRECGLTQAALAQRMGVSAPFIAQLESGRSNPTVGQLGEVARALGAGLDVRLAVLPEWQPVGAPGATAR